MANAVLNTLTGQAVLANAVRRTGITSAFTGRYFHSYLHADPWPLYVRYEAEKTTFVPRDQFWFRDPAGPSACLWIVPGSTR